MAAAASPYGLIPVANLIDGSTNYSVQRIAYTADINRRVGIGDIVAVGAGALGIPSATPTTTRDGNSPWGIVRGISFTKAPTASQLSTIQVLPANARAAGYDGIVLEVVTSPFLIMRVQASANTGAATAIGKNAALVMTEASVVQGQSQIALNAATINTTNTLGVKIIGFADPSGTADAFPDYLVTWNQNVHAMANILGV